MLAMGFQARLSGRHLPHHDGARLGGAQFGEIPSQGRQATQPGRRRVQQHVAHGRHHAGWQRRQQQDALHHQPHFARQQRHGLRAPGQAGNAHRASSTGSAG
jgi:hypothetical protein